MPNCTHKTPKGKRCGSRALKGGTLCFFHSPDVEDKRDTARKAGGTMRAKQQKFQEIGFGVRVLPENTADVALESEDDVWKLLRETISQVRRGQLDPKIANAVGYLAGVALKAKDQSETDDRLKDLEEKLRPFTSMTTEQLLAIVRAGNGAAAH